MTTFRSRFGCLLVSVIIVVVLCAIYCTRVQKEIVGSRYKEGAPTIPRESHDAMTVTTEEPTTPVQTSNLFNRTKKLSSSAKQQNSVKWHSNLFFTVYNRGKMGNQMFQYATLLCYTRNSPWQPYLITKKRQFHRLLKIFEDTMSIKQLSFVPENILYVMQESPDADLTMQQLRNLPKNRNITFEGYLQSYKLFRGCEDNVRREFSFPAKNLMWTRKYIKDIGPKEWSSGYVQVGLHVRRSDMAEDEREESSGQVSPPPTYYTKAMDYFRQRHHRVQFIIATDDVDWCRQNIDGDDLVYPQRAAYDEFMVLMSCDHIITSVGTFSWWAGWMNNGTVLYYDQQPPRDSYADLLYRNESYFRPEWVAII